MIDDDDRPRFDGQTFDYSQDMERLTSALQRVAKLMSDEKPRTLAQIAIAAGCSEAGASARIRDLRKPKFQMIYGVNEVCSERLDGGLWLYQIKLDMAKNQGGRR